MKKVAGFEKEVIRKLCLSQVPAALLEEILDGSYIECEHTGHGYFLTFRHVDLPVERIVCHKPLLSGNWGGIDSGFVVFLENNELILECHSWGNGEIPKNYRERAVKVLNV